MTRRFAVLVAFLLLGSGCAHIPYFKKWHKKPYLPYLKSKMFSFEYPRKWGDPNPLEFGAELRHPEGLGRFSLEFIPKTAPTYKTPEKYRREMSQWGSVEDKHLVARIEFSSRPAYNVQFTSYEYDARYLLGEQVKVEFTDYTVAADPRGVFVLIFRAPREHFWNKKLRKEYRRWLNSLVLAALPQD